MAPYVIALLNIRMRNQRERNCEPRWTPIIGVVGEFSRRERVPVGRRVSLTFFTSFLADR